jgi:hypothetical protein
MVPLVLIIRQVSGVSVQVSALLVADQQQVESAEKRLNVEDSMARIFLTPET